MIARYRRTLRSRLTLQLGIVMLCASTAFAQLSVAVLARIERDYVDAHVRMSAGALAALAQARPAAWALRIVADSDYPAAIVTRDARVRAASAAMPDVVRDGIITFGATSAARKVGAGDAQYRIGVQPILATRGSDAAVIWHRVDHAGSDPDERVALVLYFAIPILVGVAVLVGDLLMRRALRPLTDLARIAATIEASDLSERVNPIAADAEISELCGTLNRMFARLEAAFERQRRFTADVSHEFRAPLSVITAESDLAATGLESEAEYRQAAAVILREAKLIESIMDDLLTIARGESSVPASGQRVNAADSAARAILLLRPAALARGVTVIAELDPYSWVRADPTSLTRICVAILDNAIKFTKSGSQVTVQTRRLDEAVRIAVSDGGPGFTPDGLMHAFERFWRDDTARRGDGTGLGLAIVKALVERFGGTIAIGNSLHGGAQVTVTFAPDGRVMHEAPLAPQRSDAVVSAPAPDGVSAKRCGPLSP